MAYIALYRKWRPQTFADLVGQDHISQTLSHAITTGKIGHAYLFAGPRGTGKTSTAKILAKALNCEHGPTPEPCGACEPCKKITDELPGVMDSLGITDIKEIIGGAHNG